jgi:hypothetical protein
MLCFHCREKGHISTQCQKFNLNFINPKSSDDEDNKSVEEYTLPPSCYSKLSITRHSLSSSPEDPQTVKEQEEEKELVNQILLAVADSPKPSTDQLPLQHCYLSEHYEQQHKHQHNLLYLTGLINGMFKACCLIDCGASYNFVARHLLPPYVKITTQPSDSKSGK